MLESRVPIPRFLSPSEIVAGSGMLGVLRMMKGARAAVILSSRERENLELKTNFIERVFKGRPVDFLFVPSGEPTLDSVRKLAGELSASRADLIVAMGGGSVMDAAKAAWVWYEHPDLGLERLSVAFGIPRLRSKAALVAVPLTAGTGSEVSSSAMVLDRATGKKISIVSHELLPDLVILDPQLSKNVASKVFAQTAMDALGHAVESYVSRFENTFADDLAVLASSMILRNLERHWKSPDDLELRFRLLRASCMAGWVQNQKVPGVGHAIAHQLSKFGIAHALAVGIALPHAVRFNCLNEKVAAKYQQFAELVGFKSTSELISEISRLQTLVSGVSRLDHIREGLSGEVKGAISKVVEGALQDVCAKANPVPLDSAMVVKVLENIL